MSKKESRLAQETSPYLLQHAHNPVDWFPWGKEAFEKARTEDKPILLSIGYSACHYCHVMERESFRNERIAAQMNESFVCIKVDREERPDLDELYMSATVALSGQGGWPMTVFLNADGEPFFAGTYFPPRDTQGRPGFTSLLERIGQMWKSDRKTLLDQASGLAEYVRNAQRPTLPGGLSEDLIRAACRSLRQNFDPAFGGFGTAPKFPAPHSLALLFRAHRRTQDAELLQMATRTLDGMLSGGLFDQLGGGFCRYSVDREWLVPHFEKMLYDSAQLTDVYMEAYQITGASSYRRAVTETLDWVVRQMQAPSGGYFSSCDADSDGGEGLYYVFSRDEVIQAVGEPAATHFCAFYGITDEGNFGGKNVLSARREIATVAREFGIDPGELVENLEVGRERLLAYRSTRIAPDVDDKVITSWNGLMIRAMAHAARTFGEERYLHSAKRAADFLLGPAKDGSGMRREDGGLFRTSRAGKAHQDAFLEDYVFLIDGLLALYEVSGLERYLRESERLMERVLSDFSAEDGTFFSTPSDGERLIARPRSASDNALPNANALASLVLNRLAVHLDRAELRERSVRLVRSFAEPIKRTPRAHMTMLLGLDALLEPPLEIVLSGNPTDDSYSDMASCLGSRFLPTRIEARLTESPDRPSKLTSGRFSPDSPSRTYVCRNYVCQRPAESVDDLRALLEENERLLVMERSRELGLRTTSGRATASATLALRDRSPLPESFSELDGLWVSRLGLGSHRIGLDNPDHRAAVRKALSAHINVIDTSPTFAFGDSERLLGEVLEDLFSSGAVAREEVVVLSKVGVFVGPDAERLEQQQKSEPLAHVCALDEKGSEKGQLDLKKGAFCLDRSAIESQITSSLERLRLEHLDVCLIQSPEHFLAAGADRSTLEAAMTSAFTALEAEVKQGRVGRYGVLSNTAIRDENDPLHVDVGGLVKLAEQVVGSDHHFRVLEIPVSVADPSALTDGPSAGVVSTARSLGLSIVASRPLSTIRNGALLRLVDPPAAPESPSTEALKKARYTVASLEAEFETTFAAQLRLAKKAPQGAILPLSGPLGQALEQAATREQFDMAETTLVTPRLRTLLASLDRAFSGDQKWNRFKEKYVRAVGNWLAAVREIAVEKNRQLLNELEEDLSSSEIFASGFRAAPKDETWLGRALGLIYRQERLSTAFVGMRHPSHVEDALAVISRWSQAGKARN